MARRVNAGAEQRLLLVQRTVTSWHTECLRLGLELRLHVLASLEIVSDSADASILAPQEL